MIKEAIIKLSKKEDLTYQEAETVMDEIMSGQATPVQMSSYLTALSIKGETIDEITASAAGMRAHCIKLLHDLDVLEIVGTGGDGANSFNISTTSSILQFRHKQIFSNILNVTDSFLESFDKVFVLKPTFSLNSVLVIFLSISSFHNGS